MTPVTLNGLADLDRLGADTIIDVRSPSEYAEDHLPGAINLPVLDDAQRARVGTVYKQVSPFAARKLGAALVARNAAHHLETALADRPGGWRPLVYCWRGGQRSGSFAAILDRVGWRVGVLAGGWQAWRRLVHRQLYETPFPARLVLLDGDTGTAKTALLAEAARQGGQVIDLEGLARHRGSALGAMPGGQPSQKRFETGLALALSRLDPARPVLVEAESARIGALRLPPALWSAMRAAPRVEITAPLAARARHLARAYADLATDREDLSARLAGLAALHPRERIARWQALAGGGAHEALAAELMRDHYDPAYARARSRRPQPAAATLAADSLEPEALPDLAGRLLDQMRRAGFIWP